MKHAGFLCWIMFMAITWNLTIMGQEINIRYHEGKGFLAFDNNGNELFEIYPFDNGPDYPSDGLFRIVERGKIGYANLEGEVVIKPAFDGAFPFEDGIALICKGGEKVSDGEHSWYEGARWGAINKSGEIICAPVDFGPYTSLVVALQIFLYKIQSSNYLLSVRWTNAREIGFLSPDGKNILQLVIKDASSSSKSTYYFIPWQDLILANTTTDNMQIGVNELVTVTQSDIVYRESSQDMDDAHITSFHVFLEKAILKKADNQRVIERVSSVSLPGNFRVISLTEYPHYVDLSIATPGSAVILPDSLKQLFPGRMIQLHQVPDQGGIRQSWLIPGDEKEVPRMNVDQKVHYYLKQGDQTRKQTEDQEEVTK